MKKYTVYGHRRGLLLIFPPSTSNETVSWISEKGRGKNERKKKKEEESTQLHFICYDLLRNTRKDNV